MSPERKYKMIKRNLRKLLVVSTMSIMSVCLAGCGKTDNTVPSSSAITENEGQMSTENNSKDEVESTNQEGSSQEAGSEKNTESGTRVENTEVNATVGTSESTKTPDDTQKETEKQTKPAQTQQQTTGNKETQTQKQTQAATQTPTVKPTQAPTQKPTQAPTVAPTVHSHNYNTLVSTEQVLVKAAEGYYETKQVYKEWDEPVYNTIDYKKCATCGFVGHYGQSYVIHVYKEFDLAKYQANPKYYDGGVGYAKCHPWYGGSGKLNDAHASIYNGDEFPNIPLAATYPPGTYVLRYEHKSGMVEEKTWVETSPAQYKTVKTYKCSCGDTVQR